MAQDRQIFEAPKNTSIAGRPKANGQGASSVGAHFAVDFLVASDTYPVGGEKGASGTSTSDAVYIEPEPTSGEGDEIMANEQPQKTYFDDFLKAKFEHIDFMFGQFREDVKGMREDLSRFKADVSSESRRTRITVIITGVTVVLGLAAIVVSTAQIHTSWLNTLTQIFSNKTP